MRKNIDAMKSSPVQNQVNFTNSQSKLICPEDIKPIYEAALARKTKFVDS